jgi:hypothetical protein
MREIPDDKPLEEQLEYYKVLVAKYERRIKMLKEQIGELHVKIEILEEENEDIRTDRYE